MLRMFSYFRRPQSGQIMCYLNRTYHVLTTVKNRGLDKVSKRRQTNLAANVEFVVVSVSVNQRT